MTSYEMKRSDVDMFIRDYAFKYKESTDKYELMDLPYGWFINFNKTRLFDGRLCITVSWMHVDGEKYSGGSCPCFSLEEVLKSIEHFKSMAYKGKPQQLSIFDLM